MSKELQKFLNKYSKMFGILVTICALVGNYYVLHYRVNELTDNVKDNQELLSQIVIDVAVIKSKIEEK